MSQQAAHHAQQLQLQHDIEDAINAASRRPLTDSEQSLVAWAAGVQLKKEIHHEQIKSH